MESTTADAKAATLAALTWAADELAEVQAQAENEARPLLLTATEVREYLPVLIRLAQQELARRKNSGRKERPIETLTPGAAAVRRHREKKSAAIKTAAEEREG